MAPHKSIGRSLGHDTPLIGAGTMNEVVEVVRWKDNGA